MQAQTTEDIGKGGINHAKNYSGYIIYVDESGDHSLGSVTPYYPVFVLNFCIFRKDHYAKVFTPQMQEFKFVHFGHDIIVLHEREISKRKQPFAFLQNRAVFMNDLGKIIEQAEFTIIAVGIHKEQLTSKCSHSDNLYDMALTFCMEMAYAFLRDIGQHAQTTHIVVEQRGKREDEELELVFCRVRDGENRLSAMPGFEIIFASKKTNSLGLQLADLTTRPIGLHALRPYQSNRAWDIIMTKIHRDPEGRMDGYGLRTFP